MANCVENIIEQYPQLTKKEATELFKHFKSLSESVKGNMKVLQDMRKDTTKVFSENATKLIRGQINDAIKDMRIAKRVFTSEFQNNPTVGFLSILEPVSYAAPGSDMNYSSLRATMEADALIMFRSAIETHNVGHLFTTKADQMKLANEIFNRAKDDYTPDVNPIVVKAGDIVEGLNKHLIAVSNKAGSDIRYHPGYLFKASHDSAKMSAKPKEWADDIFKEIDLKRSFGGVNEAKAKELLEEMAKSSESTAISQDRSLKAHRKEIIFKSGEAFLRYNAKWGRGNFMEGIEASISSHSRDSAMIHYFGTAARKTVERNIRKFKKIMPDNKYMQKQEKKILEAFDYAVGVGQRPGYGLRDLTLREKTNPKVLWKKVAAGEISPGQLSYDMVQVGKKHTYLTKLGKASISTLNDFASMALEAKIATGAPMIATAVKAPFVALRSMSKARQKEVGKLLNIVFDDKAMLREFDMSGDMSDKWYSQNSLVGFMMKINGLDFITRANRTAFADMLVVDTTKQFKRGVVRDPSLFKTADDRTVGTIDLQARGLDLLERLAREGKAVAPGTLKYSTLDELGLENTPENKEMVEQLTTKLGAYYQTAVMTRGVPTAGAQANRIMQKGRDQEDAIRIAAEVLTTLRSTLVQIAKNTERAKRFSDPQNKMMSRNGVGVLSTALTLGGVYGLVGDEIKSLLTGRETEEITPAVFAKAISGSGMGGLLPLTLAGDYYKYGSDSVADRIGGPLIGDLDKMLRAAAGDGPVVDNILNEIERRHIPFNNLWLKSMLFDNTIR